MSLRMTRGFIWNIKNKADRQVTDIYRGDQGKSGYRIQKDPLLGVEKSVEGFDHTVTQMEITRILTNVYDVFQLK